MSRTLRKHDVRVFALCCEPVTEAIAVRLGTWKCAHCGQLIDDRMFWMIGLSRRPADRPLPKYWQSLSAWNDPLILVNWNANKNGR